MKVDKKSLNRIVKSDFVRNVSTLATGTAAGQALIILISPILSRLYSPAEFGVFGALLSLAAPLTTICCLKYSFAVVLEKDDRKAANLMALCFLLLLCTFVLSNFLILASGELVLGFFDKEVPWHYLLLVPVIVLLEGVLEVASSWANRIKRYGAIAISAVSRSAATGALQILLGFLHWNALGLIAGRMVGIVLGACFVLWRIRPARPAGMLAELDWSTLKTAARDHRNFAFFSAPRELLVALSGSLPSILLVAIFSPEVAGAYWFTVRLLQMPANVIGSAVRKVAYQKLAVLYHDGADLFPYVCKMTLPLCIISLPAVALVAIFGPELFSFVFGNEWLNAGIYARFIIFWSLASFCNAAISSLIPIYAVQKHFLWVEIWGVAFRIFGFALAYQFDSALLAIMLLSLVGFALNVYRSVFLLTFARKQRNGAPKSRWSD